MVSVDLFLCEPALVGDGWWACLDEGERARAARFKFPADRLASIAAHGLLRHALSRRDPSREPSAWRFSTGANGKPHLEGSRLRFNLSHCRELVAVAIAEDVEVGVDVEPIDPRHATDDVAQRVYGPNELLDLARAAQPVDRFFERWTLKESWVKATGIGISDDLPGFELRIEPGRAFVERGDPRPWQFHWWTPRPLVKLAVCVGTDQPLDVRPATWA